MTFSEAMQWLKDEQRRAWDGAERARGSSAWVQVRDRALAIDGVIKAVESECDNTQLYETIAYLEKRVGELEDDQ